MSFIYLAPGKDTEATVLDAMESCLASTFGLPIRRLEPLAEPSHAYDPQRQQYSSTEILHVLKEHLPPDAVRLLGVLNRDIFIPMLTFIFGQAQLNGQIALISLTRLRQEFYGLPGDRGLFVERACKEALHELGHTFGLTHCLDRRCAMSLSTSIEQVDMKTREFCASCGRLLGESIAAINQDAQGRRHAEEDAEQ